MLVHETDISFTDFVKLLCKVSHVRVTSKESSVSSLNLVEKWISTLKYFSPHISSDIRKTFFRLLFPEEDIRRRYNIQETTLAKALVQIFSLPVGEEGAGGDRLLKWSDVEARTNVGCLGIEVEKALLLRHSRTCSSLTFRDVDRLLDELASLSAYSHSDIRRQRDQSRSRMSVLKDIFVTMCPSEAKFMTQIILKDLRPVLYPTQEINTTRALLHHKSNEIRALTKWEVMRTWHPALPKIYHSRATLDAASDALKDSSVQLSDVYLPVLGVPIEIPKSQKGRNLSHALKFFKGESEIWAETKYDGERMQIHIDLSRPYDDQITIFSKSKRDSTLDRIGTHSIIRAALSLPFKDDGLYPQLLSHVEFGSPRFHRAAILDAEMVAYSERERDIDEFWRIRSLVESTASGIRNVKRFSKKKTESHIDSQSTQASDVDDLGHVEDSLVSNASDGSNRHLKVIFFDIMFIDGRSFLQESYQNRRAQLERLVSPISGFVSLSQREKVNFNHNTVQTVARIFAEHIANYQEGIVLKGATSFYNTNVQPWVKLKRDYIPGLGDTVDLVLIGASWNKSRARELRVAPQTYTTFFAGALKANAAKVNRPDIQVLFVVEYGISREELEMLNFCIKHAGVYTYPLNGTEHLSYDFSLPSALPIKPAVMFIQPLLGELFGAGFTKDSGTLYYSLRFPRLTKVWRPTERLWTTGVNLEEFHRLARSAIGHESSDDWAKRSIGDMWGDRTKPSPRDYSVIKKNFEEWYERLLISEDLCRSPVDLGNAESRNLKRKPESKDRLSKRTRFQDQMNYRNLEASLVSTILSKPKAQVKELKHDSLVATMKKMIPMSPGSESIRNNRVVVVDVSQMLTMSWKDVASKNPERSSLGSSDYDLQIPETFEERRASSSWGDNHSIRYHWKTAAIIRFIKDAYVWIPKNEQGKRPVTRPRASNIISHDRRVGVIYFLLIICGCRVEVDGVIFKVNDEQFKQTNKCVIFVDTGDEVDKREALQWLMNALESWRPELNQKESKELFVFDSNILTYEAMTSSELQGNIEAAALWHSRTL